MFFLILVCTFYSTKKLIGEVIGGVIRIHDDYCKNNTPEDNQKIVDNVSRIINDYYIRKSVG